MQITSDEIHTLMHDFYRQNQRLPNAVLIPASCEIKGLSAIQFESALCVKIIYAAVPEPRVAIL